MSKKFLSNIMLIFLMSLMLLLAMQKDGLFQSYGVTNPKYEKSFIASIFNWNKTKTSYPGNLKTKSNVTSDNTIQVDNNNLNNSSQKHSYSNAKNNSKGTYIDFKNFKITPYKPMNQSECLSKKDELGLKYCPVENDHLAGAAYACGGLNNIPSRFEMHKLANVIYDNQTDSLSVYGTRNNDRLKQLGLYRNDNHIFYWVGEEETPEFGVVRMFASNGSLQYKAFRDGRGYYSPSLGMVKYGNSPNEDAGLPDNDVLVLICK